MQAVEDSTTHLLSTSPYASHKAKANLRKVGTEC